MKYFYVKSVFALLVITLTFGLAFRIVYPDNSNSRSIKAQNQLIRTLSKGNVYVSSTLLDLGEHEVFDIEMKNSMDISSLARQYLGRSAVKIDDFTYRAGSGTVSLKNYHMTYTPSNPAFKEYTQNLMLSNAGDVAKKICEKYGISTTDAQLGISGGKDEISVSVMFTLSSRPVFNNALVLELSKNGLHTISGTCYSVAASRKNTRYAKKMENALLEFMKECTDSTRETVITDIQLGYMLDNTEASTASVSPVWRIIVDDSAIYYVSA